jgi:hypothetical protein
VVTLGKPAGQPLLRPRQRVGFGNAAQIEAEIARVLAQPPRERA